MKTFYVLLPVFVLSVLSASCNLTLNKTLTDERTQKKELIGKCNRKAFEKKEFKGWFTAGYSNYTPDNEVISKLKEKTLYENVEIKIIFGTWCGDSRRELPRFYKIVDLAGISPDIISLTAVDTDKKSRNNDINGIKFERIPVFIFYKNGKEIGRIVESVKESLEKDILNILSK